MFGFTVKASDRALTACQLLPVLHDDVAPQNNDDAACDGELCLQSENAVVALQERAMLVLLTCAAANIADYRVGCTPARQHDSAVCCIPPPLCTYSPRIAQAAAAARLAGKDNVLNAAARATLLHSLEIKFLWIPDETTREANGMNPLHVRLKKMAQLLFHN
jgi:hypothetical protein